MDPTAVRGRNPAGDRRQETGTEPLSGVGAEPDAATARDEGWGSRSAMRSPNRRDPSSDAGAGRRLAEPLEPEAEYRSRSRGA